MVEPNETNSVLPGVHQIPAASRRSDRGSDAEESSVTGAREIELRPLTGTKAETFEDEIIDSVSYHQLQDGIKQWNLHDFLFPPELPRSCQLLRPENIAVPFCYLLVGVLSGLLGAWINVYPLDLGATEAQQTTLGSIRSLPASFKLLFGFISDNLPIAGYRRKSYMVIGWGLTAMSMSILWLTTDLSLVEEEYIDENGDVRTQTRASDGAPSIPLLSLIVLVFGTGLWMADVMADSVVAEKAKLEPPQSRGSIQSSCYSYRFFGFMVAAAFSSALYKHSGPGIVIALLALLPLSVLPLVYMLGENRYAPVASTREQCGEIWKTVCSRSVWQPLSFVYLYNVLQVGNGAWKQFLRTTLGFTASQLNAIYIASCVLIYLGILTYKYYLIQFSWRFVYIVTTLLNGIFSILQVLLIMGITFGLSDFWFALGDDAFAEFIQGIQFLPTTIMMVHLTPSGSEGASYAMFTTVNNSALNLSAALSTHLLGYWDVSKEALANHDLTGMINLTYLTTASKFCVVSFGVL